MKNILRAKFTSIWLKFASKKSYIKHLRQQGAIIGEGCDIDKTVFFGSEPWLISIGDNNRISREVKFITHDGGIWTLRKMHLVDQEAVFYGNITIKENCNIGWNVIIMPGVHIGSNCIIGAGAIVTKDIPDNSVAVGIPARVIESIYDYAEKKKDKLVPTMHMTNAEKRNYINTHLPELTRFNE